MYVLHASCSLSYPIGRGLEAEIELHCWGLLSTVLSAFSSPEIFPFFGSRRQLLFGQKKAK